MRSSTKPKKPTGAPKTWRKVRRMNPMQRFKMYNPLQMEYSSAAFIGKDNVKLFNIHNHQICFL